MSKTAGRAQINVRKRSNDLSEEELSDQRSCNSSDSRGTINESNRQRPIRAAAKKSWKSKSNMSDSDEDWALDKEDTSSGKESVDSDWGVKRKAPSPAKISRPAPEQRKMATVITVNRPINVNIVSEVQVAEQEEVDPQIPSVDKNRVLFSGMEAINGENHDKSYDSGKFIMVKSDFKTQQTPCIWRIDGKNLLQKYELIDHDENDPCYRNMSTYSSWLSNNKGLYVPIEVTISTQNKSETIVTFNRSNVLLPVNKDIMDSLTEEANSMMDTFDIYLQTLISQALDGNFLVEITKENDDYFLTSMAIIEDHWILPKRMELKDITPFRKSFQESLELYSFLKLIVVTSGTDKKCDICSGRNPVRSFDFDPTSTYNADTLEPVKGKPPNRSFRCCLVCTERALLYHQLFHIRYHMFASCKDKVDRYDRADGPAALKACLADQQWRATMHRSVLLLLAESRQIVHNQQKTNQAPANC